MKFLKIRQSTFLSKYNIDILETIFNLKKEECYCQKISEKLNKSPVLTIRYLKKLEKEGAIKSDRVKNCNKKIYYITEKGIKIICLLFKRADLLEELEKIDNILNKGIFDGKI
jgi:DNA-binding PadR family transcriptional regulator